jgi:2-aminoadipate transaminase
MPTSTISFARGAPSLDIVDVDGLAAAAQAAFAADPGGLTAYGTAAGYGPLREWIAQRHGVSADHVIVTNGSMQADAFLFDTLVAPEDTVVVEAPTYDRTLLALRERGARVLAIPLEADGIDVGALERALAAGAAPTLAHIIPNFQNPAGFTLSLGKRRALLTLAAEYGFTIFEDDPYREVRFSGESLPTMLSLDPAHVVYASSFSKIVCPGVRVGYLVGQPELIAQIHRRATNTYISPSMLAQGIVNQFVRSDAFAVAIGTVKAALAERAAALGAALARELPDARFAVPDGGYFMWVELPEGTDGDALYVAALERGLQFVKGSDFFIEGGTASLRIAYSGVSVSEIAEGVRRLGDAYAAVALSADAA